MTEQKLPAPATSGEMFMHAAVLELRRLNKNVEDLLDAITEPVEVEQPSTDEVELREPEQPATPAKAPHRDAKQAAATVADEAVGPVTVVTEQPATGKETVQVVDPDKAATKKE